MKPFHTLITAMALLSPFVARSADFEGVVKMNITGPRERTMPLTMDVKPGYVRTDMEGPGGRSASSIVNLSKHEVLILMPEQKMYMVHPMDDGSAGATADAGKADDVSVENTGQKETILGYEATKYVVKTKEGTTELWMTDQLGTFTGLGRGQMGGPRGRRGDAGSQAWEKAFKGKQAFPLRVQSTNADGKASFKMEVTSVEKKSVPDSLFQAPSDFKELNMGAMMQGLGGMPGMKRPPKGGQDD